MTAEREVWREALGVVLATSAYGVSFARWLSRPDSTSGRRASSAC